MGITRGKLCQMSDFFHAQMHERNSVVDVMFYENLVIKHCKG